MGIEVMPVNRPITPAQEAISNTTDELLATLEQRHDFTPDSFAISMPPEEVEELLRKSSVADLLLKEGDSLSADPPNEHWRDLDLYVGRAQVVGACVRAWVYDYDRDWHHIRPTEESKEVAFWSRRLEVQLSYQNGIQTANQVVGTSTNSYDRSTPNFDRNVRAAAYAEMGYAGHNEQYRDASGEEEVIAFVGLLRRLAIQQPTRVN
jgi:hypothetical protein